MASGVVTLASSVLLTACSAFGLRMVEESPYRLVAQAGAVEIRAYGPRLAAETVVDGDQIAARNAGFRRLARYIFGSNHSRAAIAMTAPVTQAPVTIAMTAPVGQVPDPSGQWRIRFFMPARYTPDTIPEPLDRNVRIITVPEQTVAVLRYSGVPTQSAVRAANAQLLNALVGSGWKANGTPTAWFYDPPWTIPPLRRNEATVSVSPAPKR